jgi:hypothetical protein
MSESQRKTTTIILHRMGCTRIPYGNRMRKKVMTSLNGLNGFNH